MIVVATGTGVDVTVTGVAVTGVAVTATGGATDSFELPT